MEYLIGIDAGGTKSELTAYDLNDSPVLLNRRGRQSLSKLGENRKQLNLIDI